jgi:hypothetical protein
MPDEIGFIFFADLLSGFFKQKPPAGTERRGEILGTGNWVSTPTLQFSFLARPRKRYINDLSVGYLHEGFEGR